MGAGGGSIRLKGENTGEDWRGTGVTVWGEKEPASGLPPPPSPRQDGRGEKVMGFLEVNRTEIYGIMISSVVSYSLTDNGPKCN